MKVIAFNGSPHINGNTERLLKVVLNELNKSGIETKILQVGTKHLHGCIGCLKCAENKNKKCILEKDEVNAYIEEMLSADGIIFGSPVYCSGMTSQLKALIDRSSLVAKMNDDMLKGKIGASVVAVRRCGASHTFSSINYFFLISQMIIPGSSYWNQGIGLEPGDVENDKEGIDTMINLGKNMAELLLKTRKI